MRLKALPTPLHFNSPLARAGVWKRMILTLAAIALPPVMVTPGLAAQFNPSAARSNNVGVALMEQQLLDKALAEFDQANASDPTAVTPILNKGLALIYLRRLPEAVKVLQQASELDPKSSRVWFSLGIAHQASGESAPSLDDFRKASLTAPDDADIHYYIGANFLAQHKYPEAAAEFNKALHVNPLHASAQYGLARSLQGMGQTQEARSHLQRFGEITHSKIGVLLSANYGEQGKLATAQNMTLAQGDATPMIPVKFIPSTTTPMKDTTSGGACIIDLEGDGAKDLLTLSDGSEALHGYRLRGSTPPTPLDMKKAGLALEGHAISCAVGDYDNDGLPDLAITLKEGVHLFRNLGHGKFTDATSASGIRMTNRPSALTFVDFDHDGDLDLFITGSSNVLWRNNGNSTFTEWTTPTGLAGTTPTTGVTLSDINNDRAVDLVVTGEHAPVLYENQREGAFRKASIYSGNHSATRGVTVFDFNKDGWMDIALTHAASPGLSLWRNVDGDHFAPVPLPLKDATGAWGVTAIDFDNDGRIDIAALVETAHGTKLRIFRNLGAKGFVDVSAALGLANINLDARRTLLAVDVDGDGAADLVIPRGAEEPLILRNAGGSKNHSLRVDLTGLADNKLALGTKVEIIANGVIQKFEVSGASGYMGQGSTEILAGLGSTDRAEVVRMLWPTGVPQDELDLASGKASTIQELDRRGSSCPVLFAWDGSKYNFVADVIGAAVVGHWISPTTRNHSDSDEWIKVEGSMLKARNGLLSLRFGEPMGEINYVDQLKLVAVDHPEDTEVYPNERFLDQQPFASGSTVVASPETHLPAGAWGDSGEDVLPLLAKRDHQYLRDFKNLSYGGFAQEHTLSLDLGPWSPAKPLRLFLHGFIEYFSASSMYAAWQAGLTPQSPALEAQLPDGTWKAVIEDMGFPAGLPRTIVVDLTGKLPAGTQRIRMRTNLQIFWDQVLVDNGAESSQSSHQYELPLATANLAFRGYPKQVDGATPGDLTYDYQQISATGPFQWQRGAYTNYGAITPLLKAKDDQYAIFGSGEEIDAEFSEADLPALPPHWKRDYFFYADGFVKDMDFYEASPFTVAELPFHGMSSYPYPSNEHYPDDAGNVKYRLAWNDRLESGNRRQLYQFRYEQTESTPTQDMH